MAAAGIYPAKHALNAPNKPIFRFFHSCQWTAKRCSYRLTLQRYEHFLNIQTFFIKICKLFCILFVSVWKLRYYKSKKFHTHTLTKIGKISPANLRVLRWCGIWLYLAQKQPVFAFKISGNIFIYLDRKTRSNRLIFKTQDQGVKCISEIVHYGGTLRARMRVGVTPFRNFF